MFNKLINTHKIKYSVLDTLVKELPYDTDFITIYIDFDSIMRKFFRKDLVDVFEAFNSYEKLMFSSEVINIGVHYRHYFWSRYKIKTDVYFLFNSIKDTNITDINKEFNLKKYDRDPMYNIIEKTMKRNFKLINVIKDYLPQMYFIDGRGIETFILPYVLMEKLVPMKNHLNLILSTDKLMYQYTSEPNTSVLKLQYDRSYVVNSDNVIGHLFKDEKSNFIHPSYSKFILAMSGCNTCDLKNVKGLGVGKTRKILDDISIHNNIDLGKKISPKMFKSFLKEEKIMTEERIKQFNNNLKCINAKKWYKTLSESQKNIITTQISDKLDNNGIMGINEEYYPDNPIQLLEIWEGCTEDGKPRSIQL